MVEVKGKTKKTRRTKKEVKQPKTSLYDGLSNLNLDSETITMPVSEDEIRDVYSTSDTIVVKLKFPRLPGETDEEYCKRFPKYAHPGDLGMDVTAISVEYDKEYDRYLYHTGIYCETEEGDGCFLMPRSSNSKTNAQLGNGIGLIETYNYRGEFIFAFKNRRSLWDTAFQRAVWKWIRMPWYKKFFKDFSIYVDKEWDWALENVMAWAPYKVGERIGQIVWNKFPKNQIIEIVDELSETERGDGGFGSTGK